MMGMIALSIYVMYNHIFHKIVEEMPDNVVNTDENGSNTDNDVTSDNDDDMEDVEDDKLTNEIRPKRFQNNCATS